MNTRMDKLRFRSGGWSAVVVAVVLILAIALNLAVNALPASVTQLDTTSKHLFTISEETEKLVSALQKDVTVYWIARTGSEDVTIGTLLERYTGLNKHIKIEKIDPDLYPTFVEQYTTDEEIDDNSLVVSCGEKSRFVPYGDIYVMDMMAYMYYGEYSAEFDGESAVTGAISYVTATEIPKVYTLTGHGEETLYGDFESSVQTANYELAELSLHTVDAIPADADCILMLAPQNDINEQEKEMLLAWLRTGGSLYVISSLPKEESGRPILDSLLEEYGVLMQDGVILESDSARYTYNMPYCLMPEIILHDITDPIHGGSYNVIMPIVQPMLIAEEVRETLDVSTLLKTSDTAYAKLDGYSITTYEKEEGDVDGPFRAAVAVTDRNTDGSEARLVCISSSSIVDADLNQQASGTNMDLFLNALGWLTGREEQIAIHAKSLDSEYLTMNSGTASSMALVVVGVVPLIFLGIGVLIVLRRKRR